MQEGIFDDSLVVGLDRFMQFLAPEYADDPIYGHLTVLELTPSRDGGVVCVSIQIKKLNGTVATKAGSRMLFANRPR